MGRCTTATRRWPRDQKSKPKVNSRDVIKWMSLASISVTITDIWTKFGIEHEYYTINTPEWPNSYKLKIQDGGGRHLEFQRNVNNSGLHTDIYTNVYGKMHHGHAEMTSWPKVETEATSNECLEHKCVDLSDYRRYLNQILYRGQASHY